MVQLGFDTYITRNEWTDYFVDYEVGYVYKGQKLSKWVSFKIPAKSHRPIQTPSTPSTTTGSTGYTNNTPQIYVAPKDTTPPTIKSITSSVNSKLKRHKDSNITYTINFSESVTGLTTSGVSISGGGTIKSVSGKGKTWKVLVNTTNKKTYTQKFTVKKGAVKDSAGNKNKASKSASDIAVDRELPIITINSVKLNDGAVSGNTPITKTDTLKVNFTASDTNLDSTTIDKLVGKTATDISKYVTFTVEGKKNTAATMSLTKTRSANTYELAVSNITKTGTINLQATQGIVADTAENLNATTNLLAVSGGTAATLQSDNTKPTISNVTINSSNSNTVFAKIGDTVKVTMQADTNYNDLTVKPVVTIGGQTATVSGSGKTWIATYKITGSEENLTEGILGINISGYCKSNNLVGATINKVTDNTSVTYDKTAPELDGEIDYNTKNGQATNEVWQKEQSATLKAKDNYTEANKIVTKYAWTLNDSNIVNIWVDTENGKTITKSDGTGKYILQVMYADLAGNITTVTTNAFWLDNSITKPGSIKATIDSKGGREYNSGAYTNDNIYLSLQQGEDNESGLKSTIYQVTRETIDGDKVVGTPSTADIRIEANGHYIVNVTTKDNLNNTAETSFEIYKGMQNVQLTDNSEYKGTGTQYTGEAKFNVKLVDTENTYTNIQYAWVEEGSDTANIQYMSFSNLEQLKSDEGVNISKTGISGMYYLQIKTTDNKGNVNIVKSQRINIQGTISQENMPTMQLKNVKPTDLSFISDYEENTWTNHSVYTKINNDGKDDVGNPLAAVSYKIVNGSNTVIGSGTTENAIISDSGKYTITLTAKNQYGGTGTRIYKVNIDKDAPTVQFTGTDDYTTTGHIGVTISDSLSGVNNSKSRFYWSRNTQVPTKVDFEGSSDGGVRGQISSTNENVVLPPNVSGVWYLWVYTEDNAGNGEVRSAFEIVNPDNQAHVDNEKPIPGTLEMKENDKNGSIYTPNDNWTKKSIYMELLEGYDADSGISSTTYSITKDGQPYKTNITEPQTITENGIYVLTVTSTDKKQNSATREYTVKIDKAEPTIVIDPDGNEEWAKKHKVNITITDTASGVNESKTVAKWLDEDKNEIEIATISNNEVITPQNETGKYYLSVYAEDNLGNSKQSVSTKAYFVNNTNPTKPNIYVVEVTADGTKPREIDYSGNATSNKVIVYAEGSTNVSEITKYECSYKKDNSDWTNWEDATNVETIDGKQVVKGGKKEFIEEGTYIVKFRAVSTIYEELPTTNTAQAQLISEETEEVIIKETNLIYTVNPETTVKDLIEKLDVQNNAENYLIYDKEGKEIKQEEYATKLITTGSKISISGRTYNIAVLGDLNGDGHLNTIDLTRMRFALIGKIKLSDIERKAADISDDNSVSVIDLTRMRFIIVGILKLDNQPKIEEMQS